MRLVDTRTGREVLAVSQYRQSRVSHRHVADVYLAGWTWMTTIAVADLAVQQ